ncbi:GntR family transcriptional regulator [Streptomyces sp. B21-108]|uniref:GntR family transcriptional regulator n=1 Tax=Streptomyces sp. B21-108 TaxID=3039419 RepID=UPI002FF22976
MSTTQAAAGDQDGFAAAPASNRRSQQTPGHVAAGTGPRWQQPLQGLPSYPRGARIQGRDRERYRRAAAEAYEEGGTLREISTFIKRSPGFVKDLLLEGHVVLHSTGHRSGGRPRQRVSAASAQVENALRRRMEDGKYEVGAKIPTPQSLTEEFGRSKKAVVRALARLEAAGYLLGVQGRGTVVTDPRNPLQGPTLRVRTGPEQWETWTVQQPGSTNAEHIRTAVTARIADGTYPAGRKIPSRYKLAREFGVAYPTVYNALKQLQERGILTASEERSGGLIATPPGARDAAMGTVAP